MNMARNLGIKQRIAIWICKNFQCTKMCSELPYMYSSDTVLEYKPNSCNTETED
jgi:hypothetical protein